MTSIDCTLPRPDIAALHNELAAELSARILGGAPVLPMSNEDVLAWVMAGTVNLMHGYVNQAVLETDPRTMCCDNLVAYAARRGLYIAGATRARGYFEMTGEADAAIPATIRFVGGASREYKLDPGTATNPSALDASGRAVLRIVSSVAGAAFNAPADTVLTVASTTPGIDATGTVVGSGLTGGTDDESCDDLRVRVIAREAAGVISTNEAWYLEQVGTWPGVTRVCTDECVTCCDPTRIDIYPFFDGVYEPDGVPPSDVLCEMDQWMFGAEPGRGQGKAPVGAIGSMRGAIPTFLTVRIACWQGCQPGMSERIQAELTEFIKATYCVGSAICKQHLIAVVAATVSGEACFGNVELDFDESVRREDQTFAYLACEHFLVLQAVEIV